MVPKIRFKSFSAPLGNHKIEDILARFVSPVSVSTIGKYREIGIRSHGRGLFHKEEVSGAELGNKRVFWIKKDAVIFNIVFAWEQAVAITSSKDEGCIASHRFPMYLPKDNKCNTDYIRRYFLTKKGKYLLELASPGGAGRNKTLGQKNFDELVVTIPDVTEQTKISDFLSSVDEKITLLNKQFDLLCQYKKGMMQKIFSQELRFKDDSGRAFPEWKSTILDEVVDLITNGLALDQNDSKNGYPVSRIETISEHCINMNKVGFVNTDNDISNYKLNYGDMLFSNINSISHIGKIAYFNIDDTLYHGMNLLRIVIKNSHCKLFFYYQLTTDTNKKYFESRANQAVSQASINQTELRKTPVQVPCQEEQTKIANFLSAFDDKIAVTKAELGKLKTWKQGLLQQMFV